MTPATPKRPRGKPARIAALPRVLLDEVNVRLLEGQPASEVALWLSENGQETIAQDVAAWKRSGHREWLAGAARLADLGFLRQMAEEVLREPDEGSAVQAAVMLAAAQLYRLLAQCDPEALRKRLKGDPSAFARLVTTLTRLGEVALKFEQHRAALAARPGGEAREGEREGLTPEVKQTIEKELRLL